WWNCEYRDPQRPLLSDDWVGLCEQALAAAGLWAGDAALVLIPSSPLGEELAARLAMRLGGVTLGRCQSVRLSASGPAAVHAAFGGKVDMALSTRAALCFATLQPMQVGDDATATHAPELRSLSLSVPATPTMRTTLVKSPDDMPSLEGARLVVSGGRGINGPEGFDLLKRVAAPLGAALGGSLPTVDAGWIPVSRQVGQSGKYVKPKAYFAVAISGTPQHMAGVSPDALLIALNNDPDAPIFKRADVGVLGDFQQILPLLAQRLEKAPG
ncbi:MAG: hypothetical protein JWP52_1235, partial [Rhizobacter sp.]|nr:hypothetical protein [Rhizobacter sp.]